MFYCSYRTQGRQELPVSFSPAFGTLKHWFKEFPLYICPDYYFKILSFGGSSPVHNNLLRYFSVNRHLGKLFPRNILNILLPILYPLHVENILGTASRLFFYPQRPFEWHNDHLFWAPALWKAAPEAPWALSRGCKSLMVWGVAAPQDSLASACRNLCPWPAH